MKKILFVLLIFSTALSAQIQHHSQTECYVRLKKTTVFELEFSAIQQLLKQYAFPYNIQVKESFKVSKYTLFYCVCVIIARS